MNELEVHSGRCAELPVIWVEPVTERAGLALWLTHLGGHKEKTVPVLRELAAAGRVAVSVDPWQHGDRGSEEPTELLARVFGAFRANMWPILGQTTVDCIRVIDWALQRFELAAPVVAGGLSMGGDISVALAGADDRVRRVAAIVATPDWTRPGMRDVNDSTVVLDQGVATAHAQWFYDHLDPITHLDNYAHGPAITFESVESDMHVPYEAAMRFRDGLAARHPNAGHRVRVSLHSGDGHVGGSSDPALTRAAVQWLLND